MKQIAPGIHAIPIDEIPNMDLITKRNKNTVLKYYIGGVISGICIGVVLGLMITTYIML